MKPKMESNTASVAVIGVDIGKEVFHLVGFGADGKIAFRRKIRRLGAKSRPASDDHEDDDQPAHRRGGPRLSSRFLSAILKI